MIPRSILFLLATAACVAGGLSAGASPAAATPLNCPAPFEVLHDDAIGKLQLAAGEYQIKVADPRRISCVSAAADFAEFLGDYDGVLRKPWVQMARDQLFSRGEDTLTAFSVRLVGPANPAVPTPGNPTANGCPGFFRVLHDDHVGSLALPLGAYRLSLIDPAQLTCPAAAKQFARFLQDVDGSLTRPWIYNPKTGLFRAGRNSSVGFRVKAAVGLEPDPRVGTQFPAKGQPRECKGVFRARAFDRVNSLNIAPGNYLTFPAKGSGLSCKRVAALFGSFLRAKKNRAPKRWKVDGGNGTFRNGKRPGFRVKPALKPVAVVP